MKIIYVINKNEAAKHFKMVADNGHSASMLYYWKLLFKGEFKKTFHIFFWNDISFKILQKLNVVFIFILIYFV